MGLFILLLFLLGVLLLAYGFSLIYPPLLFLVLGASCLLTALLTRKAVAR